MKTIAKEMAMAAVLGIVVFGPVMLAGQAKAQTPSGIGPDLVAALKASPGILGVETARTATGKQVIFAWFENKKAALTWYYSDTHRSLQKMLVPGSSSTRTPMADVPDDGSPVLAIASLTPSAEPPSATNPFPVSQIAIELYKPLPGGLAAGGRFAPLAMKVPGLLEVSLTPGK
jgi:hypothetical protein